MGNEWKIHDIRTACSFQSLKIRKRSVTSIIKQQRPAENTSTLYGFPQGVAGFRIDQLRYGSSDLPMVFSGMLMPKLSATVAPTAPKVSCSGRSPLPFMEAE